MNFKKLNQKWWKIQKSAQKWSRGVENLKNIDNHDELFMRSGLNKIKGKKRRDDFKSRRQK